MARQWRIEYPGALYHVLSRGNGRQDIFLDDDDRNAFMEILHILADRFDIEVYAYVLMSNHYHLLLKTRQANLSNGMQWLGTVYTRGFHIRHHAGGHLFQGRFKSFLVENTAYLLQLSLYIHRNPMRAKIIDRLADYTWSSYRYYAYKKKPPPWLNIDRILEHFTSDNRHVAYRRKIQRYANEEKRIWEDVKFGLAYGSTEFIDNLKTRFLKGVADAELPQRNQLLRDLDPLELAESVAFALGLELERLRGTRRVTVHERNRRDLLIYYLRNNGQLSNQQIAALLGLTNSNVSRRVSVFKMEMDDDQRLKVDYEKLKSQIKV
jgi:putative transposase